jgi:hypothetical protein
MGLDTICRRVHSRPRDHRLSALASSPGEQAIGMSCYYLAAEAPIPLVLAAISLVFEVWI